MAIAVYHKCFVHICTSEAMYIQNLNEIDESMEEITCLSIQNNKQTECL